MAEEKAVKMFSREKIGVTVILVLITAAIFLAIGYWAGGKDNESSSCSASITSVPPVPEEPTAVAE
jgi:membrane protein YdbS with pleckstrin-like domain